MNDFLNNLRNNKDKRYDKNRRPYNNPQYRGDTERRSGTASPFKSSQALNTAVEQISSMLTESIPAIKSLLEVIAENQKQLSEVRGNRMVVEEKKLEFLASISESLKALSAGGLNLPIPQNNPVARHAAIVLPPDEADDTLIKRNEVLAIIRDMREKGSTYDKIAIYLDAEQIPTFSGKGKWRGQTIHRLYQKMMN